MEDLQTLNPDNDTITFEMMLFIVINTSSIQLVPFTAIGLLASYGCVPECHCLANHHFYGHIFGRRGGDTVFIQKIQPER